MKLRRSSTEKYAAQKMQGGTQEKGTVYLLVYSTAENIYKGLDPKEAFV